MSQVINNEDIQVRLERIENMLTELTKKIDTLTNTCSRMDGHISFVEDTYDTLKNPLRIIKEKVENVFGNRSIEE
jgi:predicted nuclease with TOPRIM domain